MKKKSPTPGRLCHEAFPARWRLEQAGKLVTRRVLLSLEAVIAVSLRIQARTMMMFVERYGGEAQARNAEVDDIWDSRSWGMRADCPGHFPRKSLTRSSLCM